MKQMMRKLFALLMAVMMLSSSLPMDAIAELLPEQTPVQGEAQGAPSEGEGETEGETTPVDYQNAGQAMINLFDSIDLKPLTAEFLKSCNYQLKDGNYYLGADLTLTNTIKIDGEVTIDLETFTLTSSTSGNYVFELNDINDHLTIKGKGTVIQKNSSNMFNLRPVSGTVPGSGGTLVIEGGTFRGCTADTIYAQYAVVEIKDGTITGNTNWSPVFASTGTKLTMTGGTIEHNNASKESANGGGVRLSGAEFTMTGGSITDNKAKVSGGGVYVADGSTFTMTGGTISKNTAISNHGGGVYVIDTSKFIMKGGTIGGAEDEGNTAHTYGGGVYFANKSTGSFEMSDGMISYNTAGTNGGGVAFGESSTGSFKMTSGTIKENTAQGNHGGGLYFDGQNAVSITNGTISDNRAGYGGGGIYFANDNKCTFTMTDSNVSGNSAKIGGGIYVQRIGNYTITGGEIKDNCATTSEDGHNTGSGGGIYSVGGEVTLDGVKISGNKAVATGITDKNSGEFNGCGGGIFFESCSTINLTNSLELNGNSADSNMWWYNGNGGGVFFDKCKTIKINNGATVSNNVATSGGGGLAFMGTDMNITIEGANILSNTAQQTHTEQNTETGEEKNYSYGGGGITTFNQSKGNIILKAGDMYIRGGTRIDGNVSQRRQGGGIHIGAGMHLHIDGAATITNNHTYAKLDWGGGGIFVNENGEATIDNALITENTADGFGGGVGACSTGDARVSNEGGAAIYGNTAQGTLASKSKKNKDQLLLEDGLIRQGDGQDFFTAKAATVYGVMLGGGDPKWRGKSDTNATEHAIEYDNLETAKNYMVLTANPTQEDKDLAEAAHVVLIKGNTSATHGGGIMCNGILNLGSTTSNALFLPKVQKIVKDETNTAPKDATFTFELWEKNKTDRPIDTISVKGSAIAYFKTITYTTAGNYTYTIKEQIPSDDGSAWVYDDNEWTVNVEVTEVTIGSIKKLVAKATYRSKDDAQQSSTELATFTNEYKPTSVSPWVKKTVKTEPVGEKVEAKTFWFTLAHDNVAGTDDDSTGYKPDGSKAKTSVTVSSETPEAFSYFDNAIEFTKKGTYHFIVTEDALTGSDGGNWTRDAGTWKLTVNVTKDEGQLSASYTYEYESADGTSRTATSDPKTGGLLAAEFINTYESPKTKVTVKKEWSIPAEYASVTKPEITVQLYQNSTPYAVGGQVTLNEGNGWTYTWNDLPKKSASGAEYAYTVDEVKVPDGFTKEVKGDMTTLFTITNTYNPGAVTAPLKIKKTIQGDYDQKKTFTFEVTPIADGDSKAKAENILGEDGTGKNTFDVTVEAGESQKEVEFGSFFTFKEQGTYSFTVKEQGEGENGWQFAEQKTVTFTVGVVDGKLKVTSTDGLDEDDTTLSFVNRYEPTPAEVTPEVVKEITGTVGVGVTATFDFSVAVETPADAETNGDVVFVGDDKQASVTVTGTAGDFDMDTTTNPFGKIQIKKKGEYIFKITEEKPGEHWQQRNEYWLMKVKVTDENGTLKTSGDVTYEHFVNGESTGETSTATAATFTNDYTPGVAKYTPKAKKTINGKTAGVVPGKPVEFTFDLTGPNSPTNAVANGYVVMPDADGCTVTVTGEAEESFGEIEFKQAGTYTFTIKEIQEGKPGYTYDNGTWTLTVEVADDDGDGVLTETHTYTYTAGTNKTGTGTRAVSSNEEAEFVNDYGTTGVSFTPQVRKTISGGHDIPTDSERTFTFTLTNRNGPEVSGYTFPTDTTVQIMTAELRTREWSLTKSFEEAIQFSKAGTYTFGITESVEGKDSDGEGWKYDTGAWTLTVHVSDNGAGQLEVTSDTEYKRNDGATAKMDGAAAFTNNYVPEKTDAVNAPTVRKEINFPVAKYMEFIFKLELTDGDGNYVERSDGRPITDEMTAKAIYNPGDSKPTYAFNFPNFTFKKAGTYEFTITEKDEEYSNQGWTYDKNTKWTWTVVVRDDNGQLVVDSAKYAKNGEPVDEAVAVFVNKYTPQPASSNLRVIKKISGDQKPKDDYDTVFTFVLRADDDNPAGCSVTAEKDWTRTVHSTDIVRDGKQAALFDGITFSQTGTYTFFITEKAVTGTGYKNYDKSEWTWEVEVTDDAIGNLKVTKETLWKDGVEYKEDDKTVLEVYFDNPYEPEPTEVTPEIQKRIVNQGNADWEKNVQKTEFTFTLTEKSKNVQKGYTPEVPTEGIKAHATGAGKATFDAGIPFHFTKAGTYTFTIKEDKLPAEEQFNGYTHDDGTWTLKVVVEDKSGKLTVTEKTYTYEAGDSGKTPPEGYTCAVFQNDYKVEPGSAQATVQKTIENVDGAEWENIVPEPTFTFTLTPMEDTEENFTLKNGAEFPKTGLIKVVKGEGPATFDELWFNKVGEYEFVIKEQANSEMSGWDYDEKTYIWTVVVEDVGGRLVATGSYAYLQTVEGAEEATRVETSEDVAIFKNSYKVEKTTFTPQVVKTISGGHDVPKDLKQYEDLEFIFTLANGAGNPATGSTLPTTKQVTVGVDGGSKKFGEIEFTKAGTYHFTITEEEPTTVLPGWTYDEKGLTWDVTVEVKDIESQLTVTKVTYARSTGETKVWTPGMTVDSVFAEFDNWYEPTPATATPKVKKTVEGNMPDETRTFNFELNRVEPEAEKWDNVKIVGGGYYPLKQSVTVTKDQPVSGEVVFGSALQFTKAETYEFTITESYTDESKGWTYDRTAWTWTVTVTDKGGALDATGVYKAHEITDGKVAEFKNEYKTSKNAEFTPWVEKKFDNDSADRPEEKKTFTFEIQLTPGSDASSVGVFENGAEESTPWKDAKLHSVTVTDAERKAFDKIEFKKAGTYTFEITEANLEPNDDYLGYTKDGGKWTLTIVVKDENSELVADSATYVKTDAQGKMIGMPVVASDKTAATFEFVNTYRVKGTSYTPEVDKEFAVGSAARPDPERTFTFKLTTGATGKVDTTANGYVLKNGLELPAELTAKVEGSGTAPFVGNIEFTKAGTYYFTIQEVNDGKGEEEDGYTYDTTPWTLEVVVEDVNSQLTVTSHTYTRTDEEGTKTEKDYAIITNEYHVKPTDFTPRVVKTFAAGSNKRPNVKAQYTFQLAEEPNPEGGMELPKAPNDTATVTELDVGTPKSFGAIQFTKAGTYQFTIQETSQGGNGLTVDEGVWHVTVQVVDQGGKLKVTSVDYVKRDTDGNPVPNTKVTAGTISAATFGFENRYEVEDANYTPEVEKKFAAGSSDWKKNEKDFHFTLEAQEGNPVGATLTKTEGSGAKSTVETLNATVTGDGKEPFDGQIEFSEAGEYKFTIRETDASTDANYNGYTFDGSIWTLTVVVTDKNGTLEVTSHTYTKDGGTNPDRAVFENDYDVEPTSVTPEVTKEITSISSRVTKPKTFNFTLAADAETAAAGGYAMPAQNKARVTVTAKGAVVEKAFDKIEFEAAGTYSFTITEDELEPAEDYYGYTRDKSEWQFIVTVTDDNGKLTETHEYQQDGVVVPEAVKAVFSNGYKVEPTEVAPQVKKEIENVGGANWKGIDRTFTFTLSADVSNDASGYVMPGKTTVEVKNDGEASFDAIRFTEAGEYEFTIKENATDEAGITIDASVWMMKVDVEDNNGKLEATTTWFKDGVEQKSAEWAAFTNRYTVESAEYAPEVTKKFTDDSNDRPEEYAKVFNFTLAADTEGHPDMATTQDRYAMPKKAKATVVVEGNAVRSDSFGEIRFLAAGDYYFTITEDEIDGERYPGYGTDASRWELIVHVEDEGGKLTQTHEYQKDGELVAGAEKATFTNTYKPQGTTATPKVEKQIKGSAQPTDKTFEFTLSEGAAEIDGTLVSAPKGGYTMTAVTTATVKGAGTAEFGSIAFAKAGTYYFTIAETEGDDEGYTYDGSKWLLTVDVTDVNGELQASETYTKYIAGADGETMAPVETGAAAKTATFVNEYHPAGTQYSPEAKKEFTGDDRPDDDKVFTFELTAAKQSGMTMPKATTATAKGAGTATFDEIQFSEAGVCSFNIVELDDRKTDDDYAGYSFDGSRWTLTVEVTDNDGKLEVTGHSYVKVGEPETKSEDRATFTNRYTVEDTSYAPRALKEITGEQPPKDKEETFTFELAEDVENPATGWEMPEGVTLPQRKTVKGAGLAEAFDEITFKKAGTYFFTIAEVAGENPGYDYDGGVWHLSIEVKDLKHRLTVTGVTCEKRAADGAVVEGPYTNAKQATFRFRNTYRVEPVLVTPEVKKEITGAPVPEDEERTFRFTLTDSARNDRKNYTMPAVTTVEVTGAGTATFGDIKFDAAGTYTFYINENVPTPKPNGWTYDGIERKLVVEVTDNGDGTLRATETYSAEGLKEGYDPQTFTNHYEITRDTDFTPHAHKSITGGEPEKDTRFTFELTAAADNPAGYRLPEVATATVTGEGTATFEKIDFQAAGTYRFNIAETIETAGGYTYDGSQWTLTVEVKDREGRLYVSGHSYERTVDASEGAAIDPAIDAAQFFNDYEMAETAFAPKLNKTVTGKAPEVGTTFTFTLAAKEDYANVVMPKPATATVTGPGTTSFGNIRFKKWGTYEFTITENDGGAKGYDYSEDVWELTVVVKDDGGKLRVDSATYELDGNANFDAAAFDNPYDYGDATWYPLVRKTVEGQDADPADEFTFELYEVEANGARRFLQSKRVRASENAQAFDAVTYSDPGEHSYEIVEVAGGDPNYDYSEAVWTAKVEIRDIGGELELKATYASGSDTATAAEFTNVYHAKTKVDVRKVWDDGENQDGLRNADTAVEVRLLANGQPAGAANVTLREGHWSDGWTNLEKYDADGEPIVYSVEEVNAPEGYEVAYSADGEPADGFDIAITNRHAPDTTQIRAHKTWDDEDDRDGLRPGAITVRLSAAVNGESVEVRVNGAAVTGIDVALNANNNWEYSWRNLPAKRNGERIDYSVEETGTYDGYESVEPVVTADANGNASYEFTNRHRPEMTDYTIHKVWDDVDNLDGTRPDSVTVQLLADNNPVREAVTLNEANAWSYTWEDLPVNANGTPVTYSVMETSAAPGYTPTVTLEGTTFTMTNAHTPNPTWRSVRKVWVDGDNADGRRPGSVTVQLLADGAAVSTVTLNAGNGWAYTWTDLPASANDRPIAYTIAEVNGPAGYTVAYTTEGENGFGFVVTNSYTPEPRAAEVRGTKFWVDQNDARGLRPDAIQVQLYQNGRLMPNRVPAWTYGANSWNYVFGNLPYADDNGTPYQYTVREVAVDNYTTTQNGYAITNTIVPRQIAIAGQKIWQDDNDADGMRPDRITVRLMRDGEVYREQTVTAANGWRYEFTDLPDSDPATGRMYNYTIGEQMVDGYYARTEGYNLINVRLPNTTIEMRTPGVPLATIGAYNTPLGLPTEEELEDMVELLDYGTPLWGDLLGTGDELPVYPFVFGGIGVLAVALLLLAERKKRKREQ